MRSSPHTGRYMNFSKKIITIQCSILKSMVSIFSTNKEYINKYRFNYGYHPYHTFSMISCGHIADMNCAAIYIVGAMEPGYARGMGMKTKATFEEALKDAKKYVGDNPNILALPKTFKLSAVHLYMKQE